jgi:hypothetical protein
MSSGGLIAVQRRRDDRADHHRHLRHRDRGDGMMDFNVIKRYAKDNGCSVKDLLVLAPQNDPFYVGTHGQREMAEWFADLWNRFGYTSGVHIRRIHYRSLSEVTMPNGKPYENLQSCEAVLESGAKYARYLGLVDPAVFRDMQCGEPIVYMKRREEETGVFIYGAGTGSLDFSLPDLPELPYYAIDGFESEQRYLLEVWIEKSTMNDVLDPVCERFQATLVAGKGELSITRVSQLMDRLRTYKRPCRVFYISDFDPGGQSMPVAVARKIEFFQNGNGGGAGNHVKLFHLGLTKEQCEYYKLPRTPIKEGERRAARFEERFGEGATELDALEARHPGELGKIVSEALGRYFDADLDDEVKSAREDHQSELDDRRELVLARHQEELDRLKRDHAELRKEFEPRMKDIRERAKALWPAMEEELIAESFNLGADDIPEAEEAEEIDGLYDSRRDYLNQLNVYKVFQGKSGCAG